jgi:hypothetical protein
MKPILTLSALLCAGLIGLAQKKPLDVDAAKNWPLLTNPIISPDKRHVAYQLTDSTVVLQSLANKTCDTFAIPNSANHLSFMFNENGRELIFQSLTLRSKPNKPRGDKVAVDLWSWKDSVQKSAELWQLVAPDSVIAKEHFDIAKKQKTKTDTINWSWTGWQNAAPAIAIKRKYIKRLAERFPVSGSVRVLSAIDKNRFILVKSSLTEPANLVITKKFQLYEPLTDINPQKKYNWYRASVIDLEDDKSYKGILYTPEDFDSSKKYPVILNLADSRVIGGGDNGSHFKSFNINNAPWLYNGSITGKSGTGLYNPVLSNGILNTPYFVSRGYIVVELPAVIETGRAGPAMLGKVKNVVKVLSRFNWVDTARLGIHGQGTSGYLVNYVITQTPVFKAAHESAGQTDLISHYGSVNGKGESMQPYYDAPTGFFGKSMWQDSAAYIWQSPVIMTDRIQTPLLMLHNKEDMITPFAQSIELFTAMRRLGKRCWLLQYDNEQHTLMQRENQQDFTIRLEQFYNHYLKGMDAPNWMTRGVAAKDKGIISGLEIDKEIKTPPAEGLLKMDGGQ